MGCGIRGELIGGAVVTCGGVLDEASRWRCSNV